MEHHLSDVAKINIENNENLSKENSVANINECDGPSESCGADMSCSEGSRLERRGRNPLQLKQPHVMKSKRKLTHLTSLSLLPLSDASNLCTDPDLVNFHPSNLEPITEEAEDMDAENTSNLQESSSKQQHAKFLKLHGRRNATNKMSMTDFLERRNSATVLNNNKNIITSQSGPLQDMMEID